VKVVLVKTGISRSTLPKDSLAIHSDPGSIIPLQVHQILKSRRIFSVKQLATVVWRILVQIVENELLLPKELRPYLCGSLLAD
jgi:hypothetical protein